MVVAHGARRVAQRQHGRRPAVLPAMEQPPVDAGGCVRHSAGERNARGLHPGSRRPDAEGAQSRPLRMQSLFRGMCELASI